MLKIGSYSSSTPKEKLTAVIPRAKYIYTQCE